MPGTFSLNGRRESGECSRKVDEEIEKRHDNETCQNIFFNRLKYHILFVKYCYWPVHRRCAHRMSFCIFRNPLGYGDGNEDHRGFYVDGASVTAGGNNPVHESRNQYVRISGDSGICGRLFAGTSDIRQGRGDALQPYLIFLVFKTIK